MPLFRSTSSFALAVLSIKVGNVVVAEKFTIPGFPTHGINVFNDKLSTNLTGLGNWPLLFNKPNEIGFFDPNGGSANSITADTPRDALIASTSDFIDKFSPDPNGTRFDPSLYNVPISDFGTSFFGATDPSDRVPQTSYEDADIQSFHRVKGGDIEGMTVADWEKVSGVMEFECDSDDSETFFEVKAAGLVPRGLYTIWNVGALFPATPEEEVAIVPFGGVPNVFATDENGCGYISGTLQKCPMRSCLPDSPDCTWYLSLFYHWDNMEFGGSPGQHSFSDEPFHNAPVGVYQGNHAFFPLAKESEVFQEVPELDFSMCPSFTDSAETSGATFTNNKAKSRGVMVGCLSLMSAWVGWVSLA